MRKDTYYYCLIVTTQTCINLFRYLLGCYRSTFIAFDINHKNDKGMPKSLRLIHTKLKLQPTGFRLASNWLLILKLV